VQICCVIIQKVIRKRPINNGLIPTL